MKKNKNVNGSAPPEIMTLKEVAEYLRVHTTTCYRMVNNNEILNFRIGGSHRFSRAAIKRWLDKQEQQAC